MFRSLIKKVIGDPNEKEIQQLRPLVDRINELEPTYTWMTNVELRAQSNVLRARLQQGESLDDILPDAFALVREVAKRTVGMRHFDVQLIGGIVLHQGKVAEMKTGEGKTLVATLPISLNALTGRGVHLVTVNDYLARRDAAWMGPIYHTLGLSVGLLQQSNKSYMYEPGFSKSEFKDLRPVPRAEAYAADITYGTNHEFGFDYLRDNLAFTKAEQVQRPLYYAIVDEVDNVFIDEARTPLIISGASEERDEDYRRFARIAPQLTPNVDYELDEKTRTVYLNEAGLAKVEELANIDNIYDPVNQRYVHYMEQALKAQVLFHEGRDYIRQRDRIVLVDEFTGRLMPDRRLSDGLHQAIEAKHNLKVRARMVTQATITIQNYFRMYPKLAGMTGTALSEAEELSKIYDLDVTVIPTNKPVIRKDASDMVYRTVEAKMRAIVSEIEEAHHRGQPLLVGTTSVEKSEELSRQLRARQIDHHVLNAKEHANEARIVARAGEPGRVTVATNMAGRGVDIKLGGDLSDETIGQAQRVLQQRGIDPFSATPEQFDSAVAEVDPDFALRREKVLAAGGLYVLGTERHEARRIDNQLRGRSGRQGEPGYSRFFLALEDDLMRRFGGSNISSLMTRLGVEDDMPIEHNLVSKAIESAQTKVEGYNFDIRKHLLEYDDVLNQQRELIYGQRQRIIDKDDLWPDLWNMIDAEMQERVSELAGQPQRAPELVNFLDLIMPVNYAPVEIQRSGKGKRGKGPGSVVAYEAIRYPYTLSSVRSAFMPFSISFLAHELAQLPAGERAERLAALTERALQSYRQYILDQAIGQTFANAASRYDEGWAQYEDQLEQRVTSYLDAIEERDKAFAPREMLDQVQRGLPLRISINAGDMNGMDADDVHAVLKEALERAYHLATSEQIIQRVAAQVPASINLAAVSVDELGPDETRGLLRSAELQAYGEDARRHIQRAGEAEGRKSSDSRTLLAWLRQLLSWSRVSLSDLEQVLGSVIARQYDGWSKRTLADIRARAGEREIGPDEVATGQWLLSLFGVVDPQTFAVTWRMPLAFLVLAQTDGIPLNEQAELFREQLRRCAEERQAVWGRAELARRGHMGVRDLGNTYFEALARFWGRRLIGGTDITVEELPDDQRHTLACALTVHGMRDIQIGTWPIFEPLVEAIGETVEDRLQPQRGFADPYLMEAAEGRLTERGYFDDEETESAFVRRQVSELSQSEREEIASYLGEQRLTALRGEKIASLESSLRARIEALLANRGRFTDERRVQDFLLHRTLNDIGTEEAATACRYLASELLEKYRAKAIQELEPSLHDQIMLSLRVAGHLWDTERRDHALSQAPGEWSPQLRDDLVRGLGNEVWPSGQPAGPLPGEHRQVVWEMLEGAGLFLMHDRYNAFGLDELRALPEETRTALRGYLAQQIEDQLRTLTGRELPRGLQSRMRAYLDEAGFFVDPLKVAQLEQRALSSLDGKAIVAVERSVGRDILSKVEKRKFINLDKELRESILSYLDRENIYRKSAKRRAFMQRPLEELDTTIYEGIAQYLGRDALAAVRSQPISQLPGELEDLVKSEVRAAGELVDPDKVEMFEESRFDELPADVRSVVMERLLHDLDALFSDSRQETELYDGLLLDARQFLAEQGHFNRQTAAQEFSELTPEVLDTGLRDRVYEALGQRALEPMLHRSVTSLPEEQREALMAALNRTSAFVDRGKETEFASTRIMDLEPQMRQAVVDAWGAELHRQLGDRRVASLGEDERQILRTYLDNSGYFVDPTLVERIREEPLATLRRGDWQALALSIGTEELDAHSSERICDLDNELQEQILTYLRVQGRFLDEARRARFREGGLASLPSEARHEAIDRAKEADRERLRTSVLASLPQHLSWKVEQVAIDLSEPAEYRSMREIERKALGDLELELQNSLLRYLGLPHVESLPEVPLSQLAPEDQATIQEFLGDRAFLEIERRVMLSYISRLWIDYLTDIEDLRQGIGLEAFGQRDPLVEYKRRAYQMFQQLTAEIRRGIISRVFALEPLPLDAGSEDQ